MRSETEILARKLMKKYKIEDYKTKDEILPAFYRCALLKECGVIITHEIVEREIKITRDRIERDERDERNELAQLSETSALEQAIYFDPRTSSEQAADDDWADEKATTESVRPGGNV